MIVIVAILGAVGLFIVGVPITEMQVQETYSESVPYEVEEAYSESVPYEIEEEYTESVPYDVQVPYTETESQKRDLMNIDSASLEAGYHAYWSHELDTGASIIFGCAASDTVDVIIFTFAQYNYYKDTGDTSNNESIEEESTDSILYYDTPTSGTYYFVIRNIHNGFFGVDEKNIVIDRAFIEATSDVEVTKYKIEEEYRVETKNRTITEYRLEPKYRTITEYRLETKTRWITKKLTIIEKITGDY
mgnify:CR=1 FL=1